MENNIIAVFNSRNKAMQFASNLKRLGIPSKTISTPRELSVSCGVSVIFIGSYLLRVRDILKKLGDTSNVKLYLVGGNKKYTPI